MLDSHQITKSINHLSGNGFSSPSQSAMYRGRGGSGSGIGSGEGSGLGPGTGGGHGGGIDYGTGSRGMINNINTTVNEEGQVCVEVHVTEEGNVISARVINTSKFKTTITNSTIQAQCLAQAKQARYKPGREELRVIIFK
ncbi:MAG: energy transducer TonB [Bacteroidales bacterium]|nr:energy transducer TonB [Bacteroidales bacterium]